MPIKKVNRRGDGMGVTSTFPTDNTQKGGNIPASLSQFVPDAQIVQNQTGIPASITLAQLILESGTNLSGLATKAKNLFGIKGTGPAGSIYMPTTEYVDGQKKTVQGQFRKYNSYLESIQDHAKVLSGSRYSQYFSQAKTVNDYAEGLQKAGYATDPNYASKLENIIQQYDLNAYDDGSITFKPVDGSTTAADTQQNNKDSLIGGLFYSILHALLIIGLLIGFIFFVVKSFPPVEDVIPKPSKLIKKAVTA